MSTNPLIQEFTSPFHTPPFSKIEISHFMPAFDKALQEGRNEIRLIVDNQESPTFQNTIEALENCSKQLSIISSIFFNLNHAETTPEIQELAQKISPLLTEYSNDIKLNSKLFERIKFVYDLKDQLILEPDQQLLLEETYKSFSRKGALLKGDQKEEYRKITSKLSELSLKFGEHTLADTNAYKLHITSNTELEGLPQSIIDAARIDAQNSNKEGWIFTLQFPSYMPFMKYAENRELRKQLYQAFSSRGNRNNENDNKGIITEIVNLRQQKANLLGYKTHAECVLEERMAKTTEKVNVFLNELLDASLPFAKQEVKEVKDFAKNRDGLDDFERWDFMFYSEKLKNQKFNINDEMTKPYFELSRVTNGIFKLAETLFDIQFTERTDIDVYHSEVKTYEVLDTIKNHVAILYLDFHPREGKQGGAWMTSYRDQHIENYTDIRPQVSLVMNFSRSTNTQPSLLSYIEVTTFLHEFGHALHGILSKVRYDSQSGTNVYRDFVELPSQLMENWASEKEWLKKVGQHYITGEVIPDDLVDKIIEASNFQSGYASVRQISFGLMDMAWHSIHDNFNENVTEFENRAIASTELWDKPQENVCSSTAFGHIFSGGYSAGYYGYKWAEVLDADAFSLFKEKGIFNKEIAQSLKQNILEKGGTEHPMDLYKRFRGHEPSIQPLLERSGLIKK